MIVGFEDSASDNKSDNVSADNENRTNSVATNTSDNAASAGTALLAPVSGNVIPVNEVKR